ncbi:MAG: thioredoxin-disulfide reductase [Lachnospiraceae bacterium]|nr:thioredoxin-disulfide reductase [Lachnospiraceae bacterium]
MTYDVIIIGSGPAGLSAAIYAQRAMLKTLVIEREYISGGQVNDTYEIDNYPGSKGISGLDLAERMREHADAMGAEFITEDVISLRAEGDVKKVVTDSGSYETRTVIIATGATHRKLGVPGEEELAGMGVSYCATCDGAFFKDKVVTVVGGGDVALEDAIYLARTSAKVYVIHRRDEFRGARILAERLRALPNVEVLWNTQVREIKGSGKVEELTVYNNKENREYPLKTDGVFIAVGITPGSEVFSSVVDTDEAGYIIADETCATSVPGIFAAGDVRTKQLRQIVTAVSDGANAVTSAEKLL